MNPKISVIITCYNYARYLPEAVESVIRQTCQNFEIIIVNDGSTDNSRGVAEALIRKYPKHQIRLINQANKGLATARNVGIKNGRGDYILPLDADDKLHPQALRKMARVLNRNPKVGIAYSWVQCFGNSNVLLKFREYSFEALKKPSCFINCSSMYRKRAWQVCGGYNANMRWGWEDLEFWINCGKHGFYGKLIPEPLLFWRRHSQVMTNRTKQHLGELWVQIKNNHPELYPVGA